jgi:hypothetical protein
VYMTGMLLVALVSGACLGRFAYLLNVELRGAFPWIFGSFTESDTDQVKLLTFSASATIAATLYALADGTPVHMPILLTPFLFVWAAEVMLFLHRICGPALEGFIVNYHPVDYCYAGLKNLFGFLWSLKGTKSGATVELPEASCDHEHDANEHDEHDHGGDHKTS